jgi:manganese/iron transport system substrate-binding protein
MTRFMALPVAALIVVLLVLQASPLRSVRTQAGPLKVVTSITPLADLIKNVGGDRVEVSALVPLGDEPEDYDPSPADATTVAQARVFFANGLGLEAYLDDLIGAAGDPQLEVVTLSEGLPTLGSFGQGAEAGGNPHLWLNPRHAASYVEVVRQTLSRLDPEGEAAYSAQAEAYTKQLLELDRATEQQVQTIPPAQRMLVTTHDAYPYFAERYGLFYLAVISANPGSDPSAQEYAALVKAVRDNGVKAVFGEAGFSDRFISQLAADTGAQYVSDLYTDTLSAGPPADSYLNAMRYNAEKIVEALR